MIFKVGQKWLSTLKQPIFLFYKCFFEELFDSHMQDQIGKPKMIKWNWFDMTKNECDIFTH